MESDMKPVDLNEQLENKDEFSVNVSIEPNHECEVYEIKYDGQEIYKEPLSQSEHLAQLISKIDFATLIEETDEENRNDSVQPKDQNNDEETNAIKFYQSIYEKVKLSLDEVSVLMDCLTIARADKLMCIESGSDHLLSSTNEDKPADISDKTLNVILIKKNIEKSKNLLKKSIEKISHDQEYGNINFHNELYAARQKWRIKKLNTKFFCDLGYRSVGCVNAIRATAELYKKEQIANMKDTLVKPQYLSVILPDELKDYAFIQVKIVKSTKKSKETVFNSKFSLFTYNTSNSETKQQWEEILEREQNAIYCKEIYNQLLREIFDPSAPTHLRPIIIGNSIQMMITTNYDLIISLVHNSEKVSLPSCPSDYNYDNAMLEYYLHCLLKKLFDQNFFHYDQRPITSTFAYNGQVKIAGMAYANLNDEEESITSLPNNISHLLNKKKKISLLQSIREKAEHLLLRKRVLQILNYVSRKVGEPHVYIEPSLWNSASSTDITVTISSNFYEAFAKSSFYIIIKQTHITILNRFSNTSVQFSGCAEDLKDYFIDQCCFHQINLITSLSQIFGWTVLANSFTNEIPNDFLSGCALIYNNNFAKKIGIRVGPVNNIELYVNQYNKPMDEVINKAMENDSNLKNLLGEINTEWIYIKDNYEKIDLDSYPGTTKIQKFELFLAQYSTSDYIEAKKL